MLTEATASEIEQAFHDEDTQTTAKHISLGSFEADITSAIIEYISSAVLLPVLFLNIAYDL